MHLTGGQFKGRIITLPRECDALLKPTLSKVRESVFNILASHFGDFSNLLFLDMFSGSGIMAFEAASRGFKEVYAAEKNPKTYSLIKKNAKALNADINLIMGDSVKIIQKLQKFDVIYIDPPWDFEYAPIVDLAFESLSKNGVIITECNKKGANQSYLCNGTEILPFREKIYGRCKLDFIKLP